MQDILIVNGKKELSLPPYDSFFHGHCVFTTMLVKNNKAKWLQEHLNRLFRDAQILGLKIPSEKLIKTTIEQILSITETISLRLSIHPGFFIAVAKRVKKNHLAVNQQNILLSNIQVHPQFAKYKTGSRIAYYQAEQIAKKNNCFDALLIDYRQNIVDGAKFAPVFYNNSSLIIPLGGLASICREKFIDFARQWDVVIEEKYVHKNKYNNSVILCNCLRGVLPFNIGCKKIISIIDDFNQINFS